MKQHPIKSGRFNNGGGVKKGSRRKKGLKIEIVSTHKDQKNLCTCAPFKDNKDKNFLDNSS